ncbi:Inner membrane protein YrbG, predicted calcium/sodium:proton antiporter [Rhodopirellula islandica]|uniref:Inner membrane protein YrbG, predicted calcium/sodium:proton antiporter n=1 Tax=Rhodopirellula islandica TaxID=595434 RepID=A0A0J1E7Y6_RHOIS|nr:calcium/sodium antiporter [Rhodopirellula islandica]KLU01579.1 Inner membrane protein YrbG, predicted calcium/sodium:proton antiporter [Rhodopirellula islandica]
MNGIIALQILGGVLLLLVGGEWVVRGASRLAIAAKLSPLFVGLTVVSLGTSAPEMAVSFATALRGQADITIGNVVGSNLFNMLMIVGFSALFAPLPVDKQITRFDVPVMIAATIAMMLASWNGIISRWDGIGLILIMIAYFAISYRLGKLAGEDAIPDDLELPDPLKEATESLGRRVAVILWQLVLLSAGVAALVFGCELFVDGAVSMARILGVSELVIGLTIVSAGTSLPELVTSVAATIKGERGIAIGNAVGSTTLNIVAVLGITSVIAPSGLNVAPEIMGLDMPLMVIAAMLSWVLYRTGRTIVRWEGMLMIVLYCGYVGYLLQTSGAFG